MKILVSAYACEPRTGSEPGAGWNLSTALARDNEVWVMTRSNNAVAIEAALRERPIANFHVVYVDLPPRLTKWKRGQQGIRTYYLLWQLVALWQGRRLHRRLGFDAVHHLTFANVWLPALVAFVGPRFVLGPVGGGPAVPLRLYRELGNVGALREITHEALKALSAMNPLLRWTWRRASLIVVQNRETKERLPIRYHDRVCVLPHASAGDDLLSRQLLRTPEPRTALVAGRLVPWKGVSLALRALDELPEWTLSIVGRGPDLYRLQRLADGLSLSDRVHFVDWLPREQLFEEIARVAVLVLPSLRDDAPLIAAEANAIGTPVVALAQGGPAAIAERAQGGFHLVDFDPVATLPQRLAQAMEMGANASVRVEKDAIEHAPSGIRAIYARPDIAN